MKYAVATVDLGVQSSEREASTRRRVGRWWTHGLPLDRHPALGQPG